MNLQMTDFKWILIPLLLTACGTKNAEVPAAVTSTPVGAQEYLSVNINKYAANKIICDPFNGGTTTQKNYQKGIIAELFYRTAAMPRWYKTTDYLQLGKKSEQNIFLSDINVPTRMFTEGFSTTQGQVLKDDQQNKLIEYFGVKMTTNLILSEDDEAGYYELALLSDDGATLTLKSNSLDETSEVLINNDGDHPTKMGCSTQTVRMVKNVMVPVELAYYQGPRYHISNILMWRKSSVAGQDTSCNQLGNNLFFDPNNNSTPQTAFGALLARGWKVLTPNNYMVSQTMADYNPCVPGTNPVISDFNLGEVILSNVSFTWKTDIISTSQILLTNTTTGAVTISESDNTLSLNHEVNLTNLQPRTIYKAQALSVSSDLGRTLGPEVIFSTQ